jgi:hypothetical protein
MDFSAMCEVETGSQGGDRLQPVTRRQGSSAMYIEAQMTREAMREGL